VTRLAGPQKVGPAPPTRLVADASAALDPISIFVAVATYDPVAVLIAPPAPAVIPELPVAGWIVPPDLDSPLAEALALFVELEKNGLSVPSIDMEMTPDYKLTVVRQFLQAIGPLLRDGHLSEAKLMSQKLVHDWEVSKG
jgi:hypothetical protein